MPQALATHSCRHQPTDQYEITESSLHLVVSVPCEKMVDVQVDCKKWMLDIQLESMQVGDELDNCQPEVCKYKIGVIVSHEYASMKKT